MRLLILVSLFMRLSIECDAREMTASWYSVESLKKEGSWQKYGGRCADGSKFSDSRLIVATNLYPLGTILQVTNKKTKATVTVKVADRISRRFGNTRVDLSKDAFSKIGQLREGLIPVVVSEVKQ